MTLASTSGKRHERLVMAAEGAHALSRDNDNCDGLEGRDNEEWLFPVRLFESERDIRVASGSSGTASHLAFSLRVLLTVDRSTPLETSK